MTVSMRKIQAGRGYDYLLKSVVRGDANMADPNPVTRYYTEEGTPPGRWMGSALHAFGDGEIKRGDQVTPQQLQLLIGAGLDPVTGEKLGRAFPVFPPLEERIAARVAELSPSLTAEQRAEAERQIKAEESVEAVQRGRRLRLHVQRPQVGLGAVGRGRRGHAGADRRAPTTRRSPRCSTSWSGRSSRPGGALPPATVR